MPIFDGHNDTLLDLYSPDRNPDRSFLDHSEHGHLDLPRARQAGFAGGFFAAFVPNQEDLSYEFEETADGYAIPPAPSIDHEYARDYTGALLDVLDDIAAEAGSAVRIVDSVPAIRTCLDEGALAAVPHLEGAEAVAPDLSNLDALLDRGVRSIGLVWSRENDFGHGVPFRLPATPDIGPGLTEAGRELVAACNDRNVIIDLAHLNAAGFWDVAQLSSDPLVVSHTGVHALCPCSRNLTDEQLDAVAASDGVVGITFGTHTLGASPERSKPVTIETIVDHIAYVANRLGVDHVAIGSDFDGATIPDDVGDVTRLPAIIQTLRDRAFTDREIEKIAHENWLRVLEFTWSG
ncbi:MAG: dipeptidase [Halobacteriales archaeon]|nr:dipeptidase [Halobacteriales archaeon]